jgi:hypothetical protein
LEFAKAFESRIINLYKKSWIYKYYNFDVKSENGIVYFFDNIKKSVVDSVRFKIFVYIPKLSKPYFFSLADWKQVSPHSESVLETSLISNIPHGFRTKSFPTSNPLYYKPPYFFVFRNSSSTPSNYFLFNSFLKTNIEDSILAMVNFNEDKNVLAPYYSPGITLPFLNALSLNRTLEFILVDSEKKQIAVNDFSQLYVTIELS